MIISVFFLEIMPIIRCRRRLCRTTYSLIINIEAGAIHFQTVAHLLTYLAINKRIALVANKSA